MVSDFRKKKLLFVFKSIFDSDENGEVDKKDFDLFLERMTKFQGLKETDEAYKVAQETLDKIWKGISCGADFDKDGKITSNEWLTMWDLPNSGCQSCFSEWQKLLCKVYFSMQDKSSNGAIDRQEFIDVHIVHARLSKEEASEAFQKVSQGKPSISWEEFQQRFGEYFLSDDVNAPGNWLYGFSKFM